MDIVIPILAEVDYSKELWELWSFKATVAAALITLVTAVVTGGFAVCQWRKDLRWRQADLARTLLDAIFNDPASNDAWRMVDDERNYEDLEKVKLQITMDDVRRALKLTMRDGRATLETAAHENDRQKDDYIRWCFDDLFYYLERLDHSCEIKVIRFEDLLASASYYIELMAAEKELFQRYSQFIRFDRAVHFMERFPEWRRQR